MEFRVVLAVQRHAGKSDWGIRFRVRGECRIRTAEPSLDHNGFQSSFPGCCVNGRPTSCPRRERGNVGEDTECIQQTKQDNRMRSIRECNGRDPGQRVSKYEGCA